MKRLFGYDWLGIVVCLFIAAQLAQIAVLIYLMITGQPVPESRWLG